MSIDTFDPEVVILGGGDYPSHPLPCRLLREASLLVCCDGASTAYIEREQRLPWRIIGDGDSLDPAFRERYREILRIVNEQEDNDQTKAVRYCMEHGYRRIALVGATGRREDHTLGNISLLIDYMREGLEVRMYTDHGLFVPCHDDTEWNVQLPTQSVKGPQVSIFNFGACDLHSTGLRYPIYDFSKGWQGTLNEAIESPFRIHARGEYLLFLNYT